MKKLVARYKHAWVMLYIFLYLPWFFFLEENVTRYDIIHVALDDYIPFCEYFIIPYLMWFAYVSLAVLYFFFTSRDDYYRICAFLFIGMTISMIICTMWPNGHDLRPTGIARDNLFMDLVRGLWKTDTPTNVFPSIHVYNSIGVHVAVTHSEGLKSKRWIKAASFVLMAAICLSTVFLKQHSVMDGIGAIVLAMLMYRLVYGPEQAWNRRTLKEQLN